MHQLVIGNKNYSSWSLRPWLLLKVFNLPFEEIKIPLYQNQSQQKILSYSAAGKVPIYISGETKIWDSMAICETIAEQHPKLHCWPANEEDRAWARSISNEMHSGFSELRNKLPMNCRKHIIVSGIDQALQRDIDRICEIWQQCRQQFASQGDFLFGKFSIADAMYAPVVLRFNSYGIGVSEIQQEYMENILQLPAMQEWIAAGIVEEEYLAGSEIDDLA
jgi:glutathione S-transferase